MSTILSEARLETSAHLHTAQELSLLRHSLADELASLTEGLVSTFSAERSTPTLLEDIETMHRSLKEQENIKAYLETIHRALVLA